MQVEGIDFFVFEVSDLEKSVAFYRDVLGLEHLHTVEQRGWAEFAVGDSILALRGPQSAAFYSEKFQSTEGDYFKERPWAGQRPASRAALALRVSDVHRAVEELRARGVPIAQEPFDSDVCHVAMVQDPDGHNLFLHRVHTPW